jgi:hypothetical protein
LSLSTIVNPWLARAAANALSAWFVKAVVSPEPLIFAGKKVVFCPPAAAGVTTKAHSTRDIKSSENLERAEKEGRAGDTDLLGQFIKLVLSEKRDEHIREIFLSEKLVYAVNLTLFLTIRITLE